MLQTTLPLPEYRAYINTGQFLIDITVMSLFLCICLKQFINKDPLQKILPFSISISLLYYLSQEHSVLNLLFTITITQIILFGLVSIILTRIKNELIYILFLFINFYGILVAYQKNYFKDIFIDNWKNGTLQQMFAITFIGFFGIWILSVVLENTSLSNIIKRKIFHLAPLAVIPLIAETNYDLFLVMLFGAQYIFLHLEIIRYFGGSNTRKNRLFNWMGSYNGTREVQFWFTHLFLYLGLGLPYLYFQNSSIKLAHISLMIIVADALAAIIGSSYGKITFTGMKNKTIQGFIAFCITLIGLQIFFISQTLEQRFIIISSIVCGIMEIYSGQSDNFMVPLAYILFYEINKRHPL